MCIQIWRTPATANPCRSGLDNPPPTSATVGMRRQISARRETAGQSIASHAKLPLVCPGVRSGFERSAAARGVGRRRRAKGPVGQAGRDATPVARGRCDVRGNGSGARVWAPARLLTDPGSAAAWAVPAIRQHITPKKLWASSILQVSGWHTVRWARRFRTLAEAGSRKQYENRGARIYRAEQPEIRRPTAGIPRWAGVEEESTAARRPPG